MGLFSGILSKKDKKQEPKEERIHFDDEYGRFFYFAHPNVNEFGYEADLALINPGSDLDTLTVYIDTDSPETTEATKCYAMFRQTMADMDRFEYDMKKLTAGYCISKTEFYNGKSTEQQIIDSMMIGWLGFFRNGNIEVTVYSHGEHGLYLDNVHLTLKPDASKEIQIEDLDCEIHIDTL